MDYIESDKRIKQALSECPIDDLRNCGIETSDGYGKYEELERRYIELLTKIEGAE
jgi:hypothetical protein